MRALVMVVVLVAAVAVAAGSGAASVAAPTVSLTITYWPDEQKPATTRRWTLRCEPLGGTLPTRRAACRRLAQLKASSFAPVPSDAVCTQIYGGPQKAVVKGTVGGARVWASFRRRNGCEIDRWRRFSPWLLPAGGVTR